MNYLEVKLDIKTKDVDASSFISNIITAQNKVVVDKEKSAFDSKRLLELGFSYNQATNGYAVAKKLNLDDILFLAKEIDKMENHILVHGFLQIKIYDDKLYLWDIALIYEGVDSFEYCLKYHNIFSLEKFYFVTKSNAISDDILDLIDCVKRYSEPTLEFITKGLLWDAKEGRIIKNVSGLETTEYILKKDSKVSIKSLSNSNLTY